jgi:hypothetical protein
MHCFRDNSLFTAEHVIPDVAAIPGDVLKLEDDHLSVARLGVELTSAVGATRIRVTCGPPVGSRRRPC